MVAPTSSSGPRIHSRPGRARARSGVKRLVLSLTRLANIQIRLAVLQAKLTARNILLAAAVFGAAAVVGTLAIVFLYIGCFYLLSWALAPVWAFLIMGGIHVVLAAILVVIGKAILDRRQEPAPMNPPEDLPEDVAYTPQEQESAA